MTLSELVDALVGVMTTTPNAAQVIAAQVADTAQSSDTAQPNDLSQGGYYGA